MNCPTSGSMYALQDIPGKGKGLVATRNIPKGTRILSEQPLITIPTDLDHEEGRRSICRQLEALSNDQRRAFLSLHNAYPCNDMEDSDKTKDADKVKDAAEQYLDIFSTNALPMCEDDQDNGSIFPMGCRINHDCESNAAHTWNAGIHRHTVHAIRDIDAGEEITLSYVRLLAKREARQRRYKTCYGFTCRCRVCSLPDEQSKERDRSLKQIVSLEDLFDAECRTDPLDALGYVHAQARIYSELGRECESAWVHARAATLTVAYGDLARTRVFAERAVTLWTIACGSDHPQVIKYTNVARSPTLEPQYGFSMKWKTACGPSKKRHWCFLGQILKVDYIDFLKLQVLDIHRKQLLLCFYTKGGGSELAPEQYKTGYTVAVLDALQHVVQFKPPGIRHKDPQMLKIFPLSLCRMLELNSQFREFAVRQQNDMRKCHGCGAHVAARSMKRCGKCLSFWYCNKECQMTGWTAKAHKGDCKFLRDPDLRGLFLIRWDEVQDCVSFPIRVAEDSI
ncbi:uncharacterized protein CPUR_02979 [Claviceps purpurea 20.1]|uniref:Uncharacterized protein n=1 Tax=Claviceps purpurea (strain 20.1) TaxID=1111077 RepID=M1W0E0_CLAP2|nr:uncharacterized protein CPUR_02979 [Claviceps purpurea 20.1]